MVLQSPQACPVEGGTGGFGQGWPQWGVPTCHLHLGENLCQSELHKDWRAAVGGSELPIEGGMQADVG